MRKKRVFYFLSSGLLLMLAFTPPLNGQEGYWVPAEPPKCHYVIDAEADLEKVVIQGSETVVLKNNGNRLMDVVAIDWTIGGSHSLLNQQGPVMRSIMLPGSLAATTI